MFRDTGWSEVSGPKLKAAVGTQKSGTWVPICVWLWLVGVMISLVWCLLVLGPGCGRGVSGGAQMGSPITDHCGHVL